MWAPIFSSYEVLNYTSEEFTLGLTLWNLPSALRWLLLEELCCACRWHFKGVWVIDHRAGALIEMCVIINHYH